MDPMGNFSVLSTSKSIKVLFLRHEEDVCYANVKHHLRHFQKLLGCQAFPLGWTLGICCWEEHLPRHHTAPSWSSRNIKESQTGPHRSPPFDVSAAHEVTSGYLMWALNSARGNFMFLPKELHLYQQDCSHSENSSRCKNIQDYQGLHYALQKRQGWRKLRGEAS